MTSISNPHFHSYSFANGLLGAFGIVLSLCLSCSLGRGSTYRALLTTQLLQTLTRAQEASRVPVVLFLCMLCKTLHRGLLQHSHHCFRAALQHNSSKALLQSATTPPATPPPAAAISAARMASTATAATSGAAAGGDILTRATIYRFCCVSGSPALAVVDHEGC